MMTVFKPVHEAVTKVYAHPLAKPALTHTGILGFTTEFSHAICETVHHFLPAVLTVLPLIVQLNEAYMPWRDLTLAYAALALGLVVYCDNAHHVLRAMQNITGEE